MTLALQASQNQQRPMQVVQHDFQSLVLSCNKDGMDALRRGELKAAFEQFKYAEAILIANQTEGDNTSLLAVTCNNLGCYYKKTGKLHGALSYLRRALRMEVNLDTDEVTLAGTHLNICAILSKLEKHDKALQHASCALDLIHRRVQSAEPGEVSQDDYSVLAIAYHNVAVEQDFLEEFDKAAVAFRQGHNVAKQSLGEDHPLAVSLGQNTDSVLKKASKLKRLPEKAQHRRTQAGDPSAPFTARDVDLASWPLGLKESTMLPSLPGAQARETPSPLIGAQSGLRQFATEETAWSNFASKTLTGGDPAAASQTAESPDLQSQMPFFDGARDSPFDSQGQKTPFLNKTAMWKVPDDSQEPLMDLIDGDNGTRAITAARSAPNDYRPNRLIKGATRTARVVRRTGVCNSSKHRDQVMSGGARGAAATLKNAYNRKMAAERIQRVWRAYYKYCQENHDWMTTTWVAATMIQATWRSYHVRRKKLDRAATCIQRRARGYIARKDKGKYGAAVHIQRHAKGIVTRHRLRKWQKAATKMESLVRGFLARRRVGRKRRHLDKIALTIQCAARQLFARRAVGARREARRLVQRRNKAATDMQRLFRGHMGRKRACDFRAQYMLTLEQFKAARKLQAMARRDYAIKRVDKIRAVQLEKMGKAATYMRKMWIGAKCRKRFKQLLTEFSQHEQKVLTIQRYTRGFIVRLRMWREAIRAEEELWAAMEIQRIFRGYVGRVKFETKYEAMWQREVATFAIQRNLRGWLARIKVGRLRRKIARSEFERARMRFWAAQRIQAHSRGKLARTKVASIRARKMKAILMTQRIFRGHQLRQRLWKQVIELRATMIQSVVRGFLTRNRRFHLVGICICIQRSFRAWQQKPEDAKNAARELRRERRRNAAVIQEQVRKHQEDQELERIRQEN